MMRIRGLWIRAWRTGPAVFFASILSVASLSFAKDDYRIYAPSLNFMLGNGFATRGDHGGLNADVNLEIPIGLWGIGFDISEMAEHAPFMGISGTDPLEDYHDFGVDFER